MRVSRYENIPGYGVALDQPYRRMAYTSPSQAPVLAADLHFSAPTAVCSVRADVHEVKCEAQLANSHMMILLGLVDMGA